MNSKMTTAACLGALLFAASVPAGATDDPASAPAAPDEWDVEITPYLWAQGIEGEVTVQGRTADVDLPFSDLIEAVDIALSGLMVAERNDWVYWVQTDYAALDTDNLDNAPPNADLETDMFLITGAVGRRFPSLMGEGSTIDALIGVRYLSLKNDLDLQGLGRFEKSANIVDATVLLRPSVYLFPKSLDKKLRFNPTIGVGGGDSDLVYELQPQLQYTFTTTAIRFGYRRLHYKIDNGAGNEFDGAFHGLILGFGFLF